MGQFMFAPLIQFIIGAAGWVAAMLTMAATTLLTIPLAWLLAVALKMGPKGVYIAIGVSETLLAIASIFIFRRGKWKKVKV